MDVFSTTQSVLYFSYRNGMGSIKTNTGLKWIRQNKQIYTNRAWHFLYIGGTIQCAIELKLE